MIARFAHNYHLCSSESQGNPKVDIFVAKYHIIIVREFPLMAAQSMVTLIVLQAAGTWLALTTLAMHSIRLANGDAWTALVTQLLACSVSSIRLRWILCNCASMALNFKWLRYHTEFPYISKQGQAIGMKPTTTVVPGEVTYVDFATIAPLLWASVIIDKAEMDALRSWNHGRWGAVLELHFERALLWV